MLRLKTIEAVRTTGARKTGNRAVAGTLTGFLTGILAVGLLMAGGAQAWAQGTVASSAQQTPVPIVGSKIALAAPVTYANKWEVFGGLNYMNFQAGQNLPNRMNLGGGEVLGTYWLTKSIGLGADYRFDAGTTPVFPSGGITIPSTNGTGINNRPLVYLHTGMLGVQYRSRFRNQYAALNFHGYGGVSKGTFDYSLKNVDPRFYSQVGVYTNRTKPIAALGASIDFNLSKKMAIRLSPDLILEHFGTETREFVAVSGGVIYRFGKK